ncbi:O-antigen ligase family protein [Candidatus Sumerlaeota bacterium]|nr:O-antigen ligase family protein [Candidatus Sumerlaeota bacterium]
MNNKVSRVPFPVYLRKFSHLLVLSILFIVPMIYPFKVNDDCLQKIAPWFEKKGAFFKSLWDWQLEPYLFFGLSPLLLKWALAGGYILFLGGIYLLWKLHAPLMKDYKRLSVPYILIFLLLIYVGVSALFLSPTFYKSASALIVLLAAISFFLMFIDMEKSAAFLIKAFFLIGIVSLILCIFSALQYFYLTEDFMLRFEQTRNLMGSFIGHNTGLSSYLLFSFFLTVAALSFVKGKKFRVMLILFLLLECFIFVAAQSRAVILFLFLLTPLYLWYLKKNTGMNLRLTYFLMAILVFFLVIMVQAINVSWNPFYNKRAPLIQRLGAFKPQNLKGTRLRILVCSQSLLREAPLFGHGFNSFQYAYPKAQGDYLATHEDTLLIPTDLRSDRAHNEYLQIAIELGFVGLIFALLTLFLFLKKGQSSLYEIRDPVKKRMICAIFFSITAYILHAFVDFPMQIPPIAYLFLFLMGIWSSGEKIWRDQPQSGEEPATPSPASLVSHKIMGRLFLFSLPVLFLIAMTIGNRLILQGFRSDILFFKSDMYLRTFQQYPEITPREKIDLLNRAVAIAQQANRMDPLNAELRFKLGESYYYLGHFCLDQWTAARKAGDGAMEKSWKFAAQHNLARALNKLDHALEEFRFHAVYYLIGYVEEMLDKVEPNKGHLNRARENYALAVRYSPSFAMALRDYSELLIKISQGLPESQKKEIALEILKLRKLILKYQPEYFQEHFVEKALKAVVEEDYEKASMLFAEIIRIQPDNLLYHSLLAQTLVKNKQFDHAMAVLNQAALLDPNNINIIEGFAILYLRKKDYQNALIYIDKILERIGASSDIYETLHALTLEALNRKEEAQKHLDILEKKAQENPQYLQTMGTLYIDYFDNYEKGIPYLERCVSEKSDPIGEAYYYLANHKIKQGDIKTAIEYLKIAVRITKNYVKAEKLLKKLENTEGTEKNE